MMKELPRIGDVVLVKPRDNQPEQSGIVLRVRVRKDGYWTAAELLLNGEVCWVNKGQLVCVVGRPKGISRIDQHSRRTHGWFVRVYEGKQTRVARLFSDQKHNGTGPALAAALAFHATSSAAVAKPSSAAGVVHVPQETS